LPPDNNKKKTKTTKLKPYRSSSSSVLETNAKVFPQRQKLVVVFGPAHKSITKDNRVDGVRTKKKRKRKKKTCSAQTFGVNCVTRSHRWAVLSLRAAGGEESIKVDRNEQHVEWQNWIIITQIDMN
jgi:hypothetical protein